MPRSAIDGLVERQLQTGGGGRFVDLRVDFERKSTGEVLWSAGARWDRREKCYDGAAERRRCLRVHDGQVDAAEWFGRWIAARRRDEFLFTENGEPIFSVGLIGGRRAGKSNLAIRAPALAYALAFPRAIVWLVLPTYPDMPEIQRELEDQMPFAWYDYDSGERIYLLVNGSEIHIKSSHDPRALKRGRVDVAIIHEAQLHSELTYAILRPAIADRGGLVVLVANPPDSPKGEWVAEWVERVRTGRIGARIFTLDPARNTELKATRALTSLEHELDERTYRREILGEFLPRLDRVFYAFSMDANIEKVPDHLGVTMPFLRRKLNVEATALCGMDFQRDPFMAGCAIRFFEDPDDAQGDPLVWIFDEALVEQGLEDDLLDVLEAHGRRGRDIVDADGRRIPGDAVVADASGDWQDAERTKGRASFDVLRRRGWRKLFLPDPNSRRNPPIHERIAVGNSLIKAISGARKLRIDPHCVNTIRSVRHWENRNGAPNRRSEFAHLADCWTYPSYRLFPRRMPNPPIEYSRVEREPSERRRDLEVL